MKTFKLTFSDNRTFQIPARSKSTALALAVKMGLRGLVVSIVAL